MKSQLYSGRKRSQGKQKKNQNLQEAARVRCQIRFQPGCSSLVQDRSKQMAIVGSDVVSLYTNLRWFEADEEAFQVVIEPELKWEGINWKEKVRYLALAWCTTH